MANRADARDESNANGEQTNLSDSMYEDFIGLGITEKQYKRLSKSDQEEVLNNSRNSIDKKEGTQSKDKAISFLKSLGKIEKVGVVALILVLFMGVMGSGLGTRILNTFTGQDKTSANSDKSIASNNNAKEESFLSKINPFANPKPNPTPQLSKEYIYAGSRMLAVEDAGATVAAAAEVAIWRPSTVEWWIAGSQYSTQTTFAWKTGNDTAVPGDYDGDGKTDYAVYNSSNGQWWISNSSDGSTTSYTFGTSGDKVVQADYDGDGKTDIAVFRPSNTIWYILRSSDGGVTYQQFGISTDIPNPADYDGDGKTDVAVWREASPNSTFYSLNSSNGVLQTVNHGTTGDEPLVGDFDGDGIDDFTVKSGNSWEIRQSSNPSPIASVTWKLATDTAVPMDYDGDGKTDIAVWRPSNGTWYIQNSSDQTETVTQFGASGDIPVPAKYRR